MTTRSTFSCFLIGADTLLMECGDVLLADGHEVRGVITSEARVATWASDRGLRVVDADRDYGEVLSEAPFDHLFAITHLALIPEHILELPRGRSVNFHDGPLPRYAGLNAPVWALINGEREYGVSWHLMAAGVDQGDLLKQVMFDIAPTETALSLNTKCLAAAVESFPELIRELADGTEAPESQDLTQRSFCGKFDRLRAATMVDWSQPASEVDAVVRALTFGPHPNPVGLPKTRIAGHGEPFVVDAVEVLDGAVVEPPGTILEVDETGISVSTGEGVISVTRGRSLSGRELAPLELADTFRVEPGGRLELPDSALGSQLTALDRRMCRAEDFWTRRLLDLEPAALPFDRPDAGPGESHADALRIEVPKELRERFPDRSVSVLAAFAVHLARTGRKDRFHVGYWAPVGEELSEPDALAWYTRVVPLELRLDPVSTFSQVVEVVADELERVHRRGPYLLDLPLRHPGLAGRKDFAAFPVAVVIEDLEHSASSLDLGAQTTLVLRKGATFVELRFDSGRVSPADAEFLRTSLERCLEAAAREPDISWTTLDIVPDADRRRVIDELNRTEVAYDRDGSVHQLFESQVDRTPDAVAVVFDTDSVSYGELDARANALAHRLISLGVGPDSLVGVHVERSIDLLVATLGVMKAGGAYVPLDPDFPADRLAFMLDDSEARVLVTQRSLSGRLAVDDVHVVEVDSAPADRDALGIDRPGIEVRPEHLAYAIYTSGSTGKPKGVLVEHGSVVNFFTGMDAVVEHDPPGVWLAVTSLSFDISVLELFWTLARGFKVVIYKDHARQPISGRQSRNGAARRRGMAFGLFLWGNDDGPGPSKYRLMLEGARFFDANGFDSVWTPERHFHAFGGPFPNPAVTGAALAAVTERVRIRSGSCVAPLHHAIRIAEEWAVVDNLSNGRVDISFAAGWQPNDFVIRPEAYENNKTVMFEQLDLVRRLWRGEKVEFENPRGEQVSVTTLPRPVQSELPFWVTTAGNPESYRQAGAMGANVLTHLLGQTLDEVAEKIAIYRAARAGAGFDPDSGQVTLMLHTFVGESDASVRELVREPMKDYLRSSMKLVLGFAWAFPAFKRPGGPDVKVEDVDLATLSDEETDAILDFAFERYFENSGLFGTPETCMATVDRCKDAGVDEIACLLDFGVDTDAVLDSLRYLKAVRDEANLAIEHSTAAGDESVGHQMKEHAVTHVQCTPSMMQLFLADPDVREALRDVRHLFLGGEALPPALVADVRKVSGATLTNMYGPTETTIWSTTQRVEGTPDTVPIGRPIANTSVYVLDRYGQPVPAGFAGELFIGGDGVTRGYHRRPDLTAERFLPDPFRKAPARMYGTGDLVRLDREGVLRFIGRTDHQIKIRGYRIELGEIEAVLNRQEGVRVSAVVVREIGAGDQRLVAYVVPEGSSFDESRLRGGIRAELPEYMLPAQIVSLEAMPQTPNGKIDRKALPDPQAGVETPTPSEYVAPKTDIEETVARCWRDTLSLDRVGVHDNFFDIGGHSLLVVRLHRALADALERPPGLVDLYRFPTIRALVDHLGEAASSADGGLEKTDERAALRRQALSKRRGRRAR